MSLSIKDLYLLAKLFYKYDECAVEALKKFQWRKGMEKGCGPIPAKSLKKIIGEFGKIGSFEVISGRGGNQLIRRQ